VLIVLQVDETAETRRAEAGSCSGDSQREGGGGRAINVVAEEVERLHVALDKAQRAQRAMEWQLEEANAEIRRLLAFQATEVHEWMSRPGGMGAVQDALSDREVEVEQKVEEVIRLQEEIGVLRGELAEARGTRNNVQDSLSATREELIEANSR